MPLDFQLDCTVTALQGLPVQAAPPANNQVLTWNGTAWAPADTQIPVGAFNYRGVVANFAGLPTANQMVADTWFSAADSTNYFWNGTAWVMMGLGEAPTDGQVYGRGTTAWDPVLPLTGGTLSGPLILSGPPVSGDPANQAVTYGYVQNLVATNAQFLGVFDAPLGEVFYTPQSGQVDGPLVAAAQAAGMFVVTVNAGVIPTGTPAPAGTAMQVGDWLYSDGTTWIPINLGYAPLASPVFTGTPLAPNPNTGNDSMQIATTSWVNAAIALYVTSWAQENGVLTDVTTSGDVEST